MKRANTSGKVAITGPTFNKLAEAADQIAKSTQLGRGSIGLDGSPPGTVLCVCDSALTIGQPVGIETTQLTDASDAGEFVIREHSIANPTLVPAHRMNSWGIVLHPTKAGLTETYVRMWGIVSAQVQVDDAAATHVDVDGVSFGLKALYYGRGRILWKESGTGSKWCKILLGDRCEVVHGTADAEIANGTEGYITIYKWNHTATSHKLLVSNDSGKSVAAGAWVTALWCDHDRKWRPVVGGAGDFYCPQAWVPGDIPVGNEAVEGKTHLFATMSGFSQVTRQKIVHDPLPSSPERCQEFAKWTADVSETLCDDLASIPNYDEEPIQFLGHTGYPSPECNWFTICQAIASIPGYSSIGTRVLTNACQFESLVASWHCTDDWTTGDITIKFEEGIGDAEDETHAFAPTTGFDRTKRQKLIHDELESSPGRCEEFLQWVEDVGMDCDSLADMFSSKCTYPVSTPAHRAILPVKFICTEEGKVEVEVMLNAASTAWNYAAEKRQFLSHKIDPTSGPHCNGDDFFEWIDAEEC